MRLAWKNILHDRVRFAITVFGIAFAVLVLAFVILHVTGHGLHGHTQ